jgi:phage tail sheath gpL-like
MGVILDSSVAAGLSVRVDNTPLAFGSSVLARKIVIFATAIPSYEGQYPAGMPFLVLSPEDAGSKTGFGSMAHRLALAAFRGSKNAVPVYLVIEDDDSSAAAAAGTLTLTVSNPAAGTLYLYAAGKRFAVPVQKTDTSSLLGDQVEAAINADLACPVTAANVDGTVTFTAKSKGPWGNGITLALNQRPAEKEKLPAGVTAVITAMAGGAGLPRFSADLPSALGAGDSANEAGFTALLHGYGSDSAVLDALSQYNGTGNENEGLYQETIARPLRSLIGDTAAGSEGLSALIAFTGNRKLDRTTGVIARPGSLTHPAEIAAEALGYMELVNAGLAEGGYVDAPLSGADPGVIAHTAPGQDWTTEYTNRDLAVHNGISTTIVQGGSVLIQDMVSFYRPDSVPEASRAFTRMRNISITQNIIATWKQVFGSAKWKNFTVVENTATVQNSASRAKARDIGVVKDDLLSLVNACMGRAWIYSTAPSVAFLKTSQAVQVRPDGSGYNTLVPLVFSGEGRIMRNEITMDTSFAVMATL